MPRTLAAIALSLVAPMAHADDYFVYFLGGQSNMDGYGLVSELPAELAGEVGGARIFLGQVAGDGQAVTGAGQWTALTPGFGTGAKVSAGGVALSDRFGPELTFAVHLRELRPGEKVAIIKYAKGGSSLDDRVAGWGTWDPHDARGEGELRGINQYDHALGAIESAMRPRDIDGDGEEDRLIPAGIVWMQGETDGTDAETAAAYGENLAELMEMLRAALRRDDLPVVIGRISDSGRGQGEGGRVWAFGDEVREAQEQFAVTDACAAVVTSTDGYGYSDPYHYDSAGYIDLGRRFAEAMHGLREAAHREPHE